MSRVTSRDGTSIAFSRIGTGPAIILLDAAAGFRGFGPMGALAAQLATDFTVFTYDGRGRGESTDTLPYAVQREVEDLQALIDAAGGSAFVHGFSSGAVLALHAAVQGLTIMKLALLEPPLSLDESPEPESDLAAEVGELVSAGRRGDAVEHFNKSIGVPPEMVAGMRDAPFWTALESLAHTLVYDLRITGSFSAARLRDIRVPTLVIDSDHSDDRLHRWAQELTGAVPNARHRRLQGKWHGVAAEVLAPVLAEFYSGVPARLVPS